MVVNSKNYVEYLDLYRSPINLRFKYKEEYSTNEGILVSIFTIMAILFSVFYFGKNIYLRQDPYVIFRIERLLTHPEIIINNNNFLFGIYLSQGNREYLDIYSKDFWTIEAFNYKDGSFSPIKIEPFPAVYSNMTYDKSLIRYFNKSYCLKDLKHSLSNSDSNVNSSYIHIMGTDAKCNNSNCTSKEDVEKLFKNSFLEFIFVENFIDVYNYTNPISEMWDNKAYQLSTSYSLDIKLKFENCQKVENQ